MRCDTTSWTRVCVRALQRARRRARVCVCVCVCPQERATVTNSVLSIWPSPPVSRAMKIFKFSSVTGISKQTARTRGRCDKNRTARRRRHPGLFPLIHAQPATHSPVCARACGTAVAKRGGLRRVVKAAGSSVLKSMEPDLSRSNLPVSVAHRTPGAVRFTVCMVPAVGCMLYGRCMLCHMPAVHCMAYGRLYGLC
jgi:hypothetical protein